MNRGTGQRNKPKQPNHWSGKRTDGTNGSHASAISVIILMMIILAFAAGLLMWNQHQRRSQAQASASPSSSAAPSKDAGTVPAPTPNAGDTPSPTDSAQSQDAVRERQRRARDFAERTVNEMSIEERCGQLVMASLAAGTDPASVSELVTQDHVGSVILMGNWQSGVAGIADVTYDLQSYASVNSQLPLLIATDQEGGQVQHLQGPGFSTMPSAVQQGRMSLADLRSQAGVWGGELKQAGVNIDLAPSVDTVTIPRNLNQPIGALDRDFALDARGNAEHASAFIDGMQNAGVGTSPKHYPGLGGVEGNTDFTDSAITDTTTTRESDELGAFNTVIRNTDPAMVMMSLATYTQLDPNNPAAFSHTIVTDILRGDAGYQGVVISDSLSASAVSGIAPSELGVRLVNAGGDIACINDPSYAFSILQGLRAEAANDPGFAQKVTESAKRVVALKYRMGLVSQ